jgi:hypothetical protein
MTDVFPNVLNEQSFSQVSSCYFNHFQRPRQLQTLTAAPVDSNLFRGEIRGDEEVFQVFSFVRMLRHKIAEHLVITMSEPE